MDLWKKHDKLFLSNFRKKIVIIINVSTFCAYLWNWEQCCQNQLRENHFSHTEQDFGAQKLNHLVFFPFFLSFRWDGVSSVLKQLHGHTRGALSSRGLSYFHESYSLFFLSSFFPSFLIQLFSLFLFFLSFSLLLSLSGQTQEWTNSLDCWKKNR